MTEPASCVRRSAGSLRLVLFCHPQFVRSQSMPRFAQMLKHAYEARGHLVEIWAPRPRVFRVWPRGPFAKWAGYVDQYVIFPLEVRRALARSAPETLFVFCDQALGPWVPLVRHRPHVVHVHDLLALRSALGEFPEHRTGVSGRIYQRYIRRGFAHARHFISVSRKTREDLHRFARVQPLVSEVVTHGLNYPYRPLEREVAEARLRAGDLSPPPPGFLLHVGGGQWYKNLPGIVRLYAAYARATRAPAPLWCVGPPPNAAVRAALDELPSAAAVQFLGRVDSGVLEALYSSARVLLFPSLEEGFGWPLIEAQACGCPVITTDAAPMNEIAGPAALYLPRPLPGGDLRHWAQQGAASLATLLQESPDERRVRVESGRRWVQRFDHDRAIEGYLAVYRRALEMSSGAPQIAAGLHDGSAS
jgi:glycosyltransferase involved in cell wall biosynthesis